MYKYSFSQDCPFLVATRTHIYAATTNPITVNNLLLNIIKFIIFPIKVGLCLLVIA